MAEETIGWFAAVDWGSKKHQACVLDARGGVAGEREFLHSGAGLAELADWVQSTMTWPRPATSVSRGPDVRQSAASTATTRSWARASTASRRIRPTCAWPSPRWTQWCAW